MLWICFALFCLAMAAEGQLRAWHCPWLLSLIVETAWWRQLSSALHTNDINRHTVHTPKDSDRRTFHNRKEMIEKESWTIEKERKQKEPKYGQIQFSPLEFSQLSLTVERKITAWAYIFFQMWLRRRYLRKLYSKQERERHKYGKILYTTFKPIKWWLPVDSDGYCLWYNAYRKPWGRYTKDTLKNIQNGIL